ncbi:MAG TPA: carbohydrate-binding family 9-like protein [Pyrinomonadaceae bacterium]|jgi:hypothetical protein|nr:carbohydrate-binding family 9-like protein [Pyrinomonadaceae bacterium]
MQVNTEEENTKTAIVTAHYTTGLATSQFDHSDWATARPIRIASRWSGEPAPESQHAEARIIWSEEFLAVRFVCAQSEPPIVSANPQLNQKTLGLWERDVCEIFIAPDSEAPHRYFEFEAAPTGEWVDLAIEFTAAERETNFEFHSGMKVAAAVGGPETIIIISIPWSVSLPKPRRGDTWRVNLFRCVGLGNERYLAWQPTYSAEPNFHVPEVFGWLDFA